MKPKISVITVSLNSERFLPECISSVAAQGESLFEHIIVDGGSTDSTVSLIRAYAQSDSRVRWISEPDRGISDAMNKGVALATGDVITHLNSDDFYPDSNVLEIVRESFLLHPESVWMTAGSTFVSQESVFIRDVRVRRYSYRRLMRGNILLHPSTFIKRDQFNALGGFDLSLSFCMDYELFLRLGNIVPPLVVDKQLSCFRVHTGSRSVFNAVAAYEEEYNVKCNYLRSKGIPTLHCRFFYQIKRILNKFHYVRLLSANRA